MSSWISWAVYDENGLPLASLPIGPGGVELVDYRDSTGARSQPTIVNRGGGQYGFQPSQADRDAGTAYLVKNGTGFPSYVSGPVTTPAKPMSVWALFDQDGVLWTGAPATISSFLGPTPAVGVQARRTYLMVVAPNPALHQQDISFIAASPPGADPQFVHDEFALTPAPVVTSPASPTPISDCAATNDLSDAIEMLRSGCYIVTRSSPTSMLNGRRVAPSTSTFEIVASAQPASGRDLRRLPEGIRTRETMAVFTRTELFQARPEAAQEADRVAIDGASFEVQIVERWAALGNYFRCVVARI